MGRFDSLRRCVAALSGLASGLFVFGASAFIGDAQQRQPQGFAVERFYPSAPGGGWFVMDDLNIFGGLGGAISLTGGYARNPLQVSAPGGTQPLALVWGEAFTDIGASVTYDRYRVYFDLPFPLVVTGMSGIVGPYRLMAPSLNIGANPDTISDPRIGFDIRLFGKPRSALRLGMGAQLIFPSGNRADYVTDARYRGMFRFLAAGDSGAFTYAGQLGVHVRTLNDAPAPGSPDGSEFLFGVSAGRRLPVRRGWEFIVGPEIYGETAFHAFFSGETGAEGLLTGRLEGTGTGRNLRFKLGIGHSLVHDFGVPQWRVVFGVELIGHK
jgi:hypothetical protein